MALLCTSLAPAAAHAASSLESPVSEGRLLPLPPPVLPGWSLADDTAIQACEQFRIMAADAPAAPCHATLMAEATESGPSGTDRDEVEPEIGRQPPSRFWTYAIPPAVVAGFAANAFLETPHQSFHFTNEGWFGRNTYAGGADKASHLVDFYIISKELSYLYNTLGYSRTQSIWLGLGVTLLGGLTNEFGDGFNRYGFSYSDLVMDTAGAGLAALVSALGAHDLIGFRRGFLLPPYSDPPGCCPGDNVGQAYQSQIFTADLKLAGLARRLNLNVGPLRYLLLSVTYGTKGYATGIPALQERQLGVEVGLNAEEVLNAVGVRRNTWWGYTLHVFLDNIRVPFTAVGFQVDLNSGRWFGPGNGNSYATR